MTILRCHKLMEGSLIVPSNLPPTLYDIKNRVYCITSPNNGDINTLVSIRCMVKALEVSSLNINTCTMKN